MPYLGIDLTVLDTQVGIWSFGLFCFSFPIPLLQSLTLLVSLQLPFLEIKYFLQGSIPLKKLWWNFKSMLILEGNPTGWKYT